MQNKLKAEMGVEGQTIQGLVSRLVIKTETLRYNRKLQYRPQGRPMPEKGIVITEVLTYLELALFRFDIKGSRTLIACVCVTTCNLWNSIELYMV